MQNKPDLQQIIHKYDLSSVFSERLYALSRFDTVVICDDSGSMRNRVDDGRTRWEELKETIEIIIGPVE